MYTAAMLVSGVPADLVPREFGPPGPNPLADLVPPVHGGPNLLADLVFLRGFGPLYFRDMQNYKMLTRVNLFSFEGQTMSLR